MPTCVSVACARTRHPAGLWLTSAAAGTSPTAQYRGQEDIKNSVFGGCVTGGALGLRAGPQAAMMGCAGFAAFSAVIDIYFKDMF